MRLQSEWGDLNKKLLAEFFEVVKVGERWVPVADGNVVAAPLTEADMEITLNWNSPFEQAGAETKAPTMMAMLQSGELTQAVDAASSLLDSNLVRKARDKSNEFLRQFEGRTGMTKLNSTQVFTGMPPIKIPVTLLFRAWENPEAEVHAPFDQLMKWALPVKLSDDGTLAVQFARFAASKVGYAEALMPSLAPTKIGLRYKKRVYMPLVIESIGNPINSPITKDGDYTEYVVPMTLCTLAALDRDDWSVTRKSIQLNN